MSAGNWDSRTLREIAEELFEGLPDTACEIRREDFVTSVVRQWVTYDGIATFFMGEAQVYLLLNRTPLGNLCVVPETTIPVWSNQLESKWKIDPAEIPGIIEQLNLGQSAEVLNTEDALLRLWVNPKEKSTGVEQVVKRPDGAHGQRDYRALAGEVLGQQLGMFVDDEEIDALTGSVAEQWRQHQGHACLFLDRGQQLVLVLREADKKCKITVKRVKVAIEPLLRSFGIADEAISEVIARINLGQEVAFQDKNGSPAVLWHDPRERRIRVRGTQPPRQHMKRPILCPNCTAVLRWQKDARETTCPHCGQAVGVS